MLRQIRHIITIATIVIVQTLVAQERTDAVTFSQQGGFYDESFELTLMCGAENHIRYTINGNTPTPSSELYTEPLFLDSALYSKSNIYTIENCPKEDFFLPDTILRCIVIRAAVFDENENRISPVATHSYFISSLGFDSHGLPTISLCADSTDLFDYETGIFVPGIHFSPENPYWTGNYYETGDDWERPCNIEFYETDNSGINQICGLRTHGGNSRRYIQKGLKIYAREKYGNKRFKHKFFSDSNVKSFKHLIIKPFEASWGYAGGKAGVQDYVALKIARNLDLETPSVRPSIVFINGEYWGIYFLEERPDSHFIEDNFGINPDECNVIEDWNGSCSNGNNSSFLNLASWLRQTDLSIDENYDIAKEKIDISNFIDYYIFEMFTANQDWPANNMHCWQHKDSAFRWIFFDGDGCLRYMDMDVFANATYTGDDTWPSSEAATLFFRKLYDNEDFKASFYNRFYYLLDNELSYNNTAKPLDSIIEILNKEIPFHRDRFENASHSWGTYIAEIDNFLLNREENMRQQLDELNYVVETTLHLEDLYPNPTNGDFYLTIVSEDFTANDIVVYNMLGQPLATTNVMLYPGENTIKMSCHYPHGIYAVKFGNKTKRFVIQ